MEEKEVKELKEGQWYKFWPYKSDPQAMWCMKCSDPKGSTASKYTQWSVSDKVGTTRKFVNSPGNFHNNYPFYEVSFKEFKWLEEIEKREAFFPIEEFKFDEVINNYLIY